ncbi:DUF1266 domain-containing protein [Salinicola rhizosphaerae]|uniref:DUF1266 domain-containing protein n=1 Tax=Salinicola rhizosphaerae TaxID=1443141 RepID=A0ABQ3E7U7_9GAMM|nr:DUF1266 domain-containing protein [Salinicola rhizosphaerae]GHB27771.1 hypothetical protein GCM10009038_28070 [Salinicola rhizosphaerae]
MRELLSRWWARQLTLCGWPAVGDPRRALSRDAAFERLMAAGIGDRDELTWRLWESVADDHDPALARLAALELLALGATLGWISAAAETAWLQYLATEITRRYASLGRWLEALTVHRDPILGEAAQDLRLAERQGRGVDWSTLTVRLNECSETDISLWQSDLWRARAAFAPVLDWPMSFSADEQRLRQRLLREEGEVSDRAGLMASLWWLSAQGDRYGWDMDARRLAREGQSEALTWLSTLGEQRDYGRVLLAFLADGEPLDWAAWDWLRLIDQAYWGHAAGWLGEDEAAAFAAHALDLLQQRYADWREVAKAYQRGRSLFEGRDQRAQFDADWERLLISPVSPWQKPLGEVLSVSRREAARARVRQREDSADAWVLAIAAVREPDLVHRRGLDDAVVPQRREEACRYLDDVLGLREDEGIDGLSRFWMPAQAHHLNQLAADARARGGRQRALAACAEHAATIVMAEKYAFYLLMAADSGRYAAGQIESLARAFRDVLSRFYVSPEQMLKAWQAWEAALSGEEPMDEAPLADDLAWHLADPGSRFVALTPSAALIWQEPGPRPTLSRFTAIALAGPLNEALWQTPRPVSFQERQALADWLDMQYGLQGAEGLANFLDFLVEAGDRQEYQINYAPYTLNRARLEAEIAILESGECGDEERVHLARLQRVRDNDAHCNDVDMTAWDAAQLVDLALAGRQLGWLDESRLGHYLDSASRLAGSRYSGWRDYAEGLFSGFAFFMDNTPERGAFLVRFREALNAWLNAEPLLAGAWASLDFPASAGSHWTPLHIDILPGEPEHLH